MLYTSERNYGCRFLEIALFGYRALILENEKIRTLILLDKGTEIVELNHKQSDTDFLWRSPLGLSCLQKIRWAPRDDQILTDGYTGGWFEAFPNVGPACTYKGAHLPHYGEACYLPWEYAVVKDEPSEVAIRCFVRTTKFPCAVEKTFTLKTGVATLFIEESVKNLGGEDLHYQWGHHPNFGPPFIDENCVIDMPKADLAVDYSAPSGRLETGAEGTWPFVRGRNGTTVDLRSVPAGGSGLCEEIAVKNLREGRLKVTNLKTRTGIRLEWDVTRFPHNLMWLVCNGDIGYPRYGATHVLGFVPRNDAIRGLAQSVTDGNAALIRPGEIVTLWISATAELGL